MKIKQTRQVRLDELLRLVWDGAIKEGVYEINGLGRAHVTLDELILINRNHVEKTDLFTITEEVEIDYDTRLDLIAVRKVGTVSRFENRSIQGVLVHFEGEVDYIYFQNPDGSIADLIWSKERGLHH